jgi:hypothetical protein
LRSLNVWTADGCLSVSTGGILFSSRLGNLESLELSRWLFLPSLSSRRYAIGFFCMLGSSERRGSGANKLTLFLNGFSIIY